ncbi:unnamed protein product [Fraxinus pennsylvanica]|uniref:Uncharacterized protein n=1 Tax=Fraxinus pennsylvanica TaxID=56036 RepID=A0AAD1Z6E2_9LAMI|nr:unnamed protein product [Fraxinus pennsylvanica]
MAGRTIVGVVTEVLYDGGFVAMNRHPEDHCLVRFQNFTIFVELCVCSSIASAAKAANVHFHGLNLIESKVYLSPKLWYLRVSEGSTRHYFGRQRRSSIAKEGEEMAQLYTLDKRRLFSHVCSEISLKLYLSTKEEVKQVISSDGSSGGVVVSGGAVSKKQENNAARCELDGATSDGSRKQQNGTGFSKSDPARRAKPR